MNDLKFCKMCGVLISDATKADCNYYRHIRIKYCDCCRKVIEGIQNTNRQKDFRQRNKKIAQLRDEKLSLLQEENQLLRQRVIQLREEVQQGH